MPDQYRNPDNYDLVKEALVKAGREDLIGFDQKCLIKPRKMTKDIADRKKVGTRTGKKPGNGKTEGKGHQVLSGRAREWRTDRGKDETEAGRTKEITALSCADL